MDLTLEEVISWYETTKSGVESSWRFLRENAKVLGLERELVNLGQKAARYTELATFGLIDIKIEGVPYRAWTERELAQWKAEMADFHNTATGRLADVIMGSTWGPSLSGPVVDSLNKIADSGQKLGVIMPVDVPNATPVETPNEFEEFSNLGGDVDFSDPLGFVSGQGGEFPAEGISAVGDLSNPFTTSIPGGAGYPEEAPLYDPNNMESGAGSSSSSCHNPDTIKVYRRMVVELGATLRLSESSIVKLLKNFNKLAQDPMLATVYDENGEYRF